jgi:hypothetical protein
MLPRQSQGLLIWGIAFQDQTLVITMVAVEWLLKTGFSEYYFWAKE